jgi:hypothetical protein
MKKIGIFGVVLIIIAGSASAAVSLKLSGGMTYLLDSDYNQGVRGAYEYYSDNFSGVSGQYHAFHLGLHFGGEVIVALGPRFGIGLGVGYIRASRQSAFGYEWWDFSEEESYKPTLSIVPLSLNLHYALPLGGPFVIDIYGGPGYYIASFQHEGTLTSNFFGYEETTTFKAQKGVVGGQGGIGLEFQMNSVLGLVVQAEGRLARISDPTGDWTDQVDTLLVSWREQGRGRVFWCYDIGAGGTDYPRIAFSKTQPSDILFSNIRKGSINLSGISAMAGLKIRF